MAGVQAIVVASVVPSLTQTIREGAGDLLPQGIPIHVIDPSWPFSYSNQTDSPQQVGTDRLVNAEAAIRDYGFPCIVIDSGTATTLCGISKTSAGKAEFLGGAIIPGLKLSMEALAQNTAQLFKVELTPPPFAIGRNTEDALRSGLLFGYASMIDGMVRRFKEELGVAKLPVIATGGVSHLLKGLLREQTHFDFSLTLRGISYLYDNISHASPSSNHPFRS